MCLLACRGQRCRIPRAGLEGGFEALDMWTELWSLLREASTFDHWAVFSALLKAFLTLGISKLKNRIFKHSKQFLIYLEGALPASVSLWRSEIARGNWVSLPCGSQGSNLGLHAWWQVLTEPCYRLKNMIKDCLCVCVCVAMEVREPHKRVYSLIAHGLNSGSQATWKVLLPADASYLTRLLIFWNWIWYMVFIPATWDNELCVDYTL